MDLAVNLGREIVIVLLLLAMWGRGIYHFVIAWREARTTLQLGRDGVTFPGQITNWNVPMGRRAGKLRKVAFAYKVDGTTYMGHQILWKAQLETIAHQGQHVEIRYLAGNPYRARLNALFTKTPMVAQHRLNATFLFYSLAHSSFSLWHFFIGCQRISRLCFLSPADSLLYH